MASNSRARAPCRRSWRLRGRIFPASGQADDGDERWPGGRWRGCTMKVTGNRTGVTAEMAVTHSPPMVNVRSIFPAGPQSSLPEVRLHFDRRTLPGTCSLTRPGNVLCPDKKPPASARALEPRLPRSWLPWPRRSRPRSRSLPSDACLRLSYAVSGGSALSWWLYDQLLLVGTLALWYVHPFPPLACNHMTIPGLYSTPPLNHSIRP